MTIWNCGCGDKTDKEIDEEIERILREIEEGERPVLVPVDPGAISAPDVFTRKVKKEEAVPV